MVTRAWLKQSFSYKVYYNYACTVSLNLEDKWMSSFRQA